ncbi:MAG: PEP-CTERM sorting domain-containing protein [Stellaceae bacterium]
MRRQGILHGFLVLALAMGAALSIKPAAATVIGFDDLTDSGNGTAIANGYQGLDWNNFDVLNTADFTANVGANGAAAGTTSPPNIAFNGNGDFASFTSTSTFNLVSADMTAFWNDGMTVTVTGLLNGTRVDTETVTVNSTSPTLETFTFADINEVDITTSGGTQNNNYAGSGTEVAIDDLTITPTQVSVPEPSTLALFAAGLAGFLGLGLMRRRKAG